MIKKLIPKRVLNTYRQVKKNHGVNIYKQHGKLVKNHVQKVSVVIPNYNYEKLIVERIDSIIRQTYPIYEIIVLDDCSKDNSVAVIKNKLKTIQHIKTKLIVNDKNSGSVFKQWQKGFEEAKGDYVWIAEADDSANCHFLETAMRGFEDKDVILSYTESMRIDLNNKIIQNSCRDWMEGVSSTRWNKSYIVDGKDEIINCLSICNTIPNVSAVVWKKQDYHDIFKEAQKFKISGDWYIYYHALQNGKIAYHKKSLNYFRKHNQSASTVVKVEMELKELLWIQKDIRDHYVLPSNIIHKQSYRYGTIIQKVDEKVKKEVEPFIAKKIAWIIPAPIKGSGGIRTMIQNANALVKKGYECDIYIEEDYINDSMSMKRRIENYYGECLADVYVGIEFRKQYDLAFCTYSILTADYLNFMDVPRKAYFIQDFEPWFEPMGGLYLQMEKSYKYHFYGISIGKWLTYKLSNEFDMSMNYFDFCADLNIYHKLDGVEKEDAVCFIYQPEKARRCSNLGIDALRLVKKLRPEIKIYLYGSDQAWKDNLEVENLNIISLAECNKLYNKCKVGLCISASNPSRIPFEMMAAGLPVVDLYRENNLYDVPDGGVLLADSTPEAIATAIIKIYDDEKLQKKMSTIGESYMKNHPIEKGFEQFYQFVEDVLNDKIKPNNKIKSLYKTEKITPSDEVLNVSNIVRAIPVAISHHSKMIRQMVRIKKKIEREVKELVRKVFGL